jgi:eukaryotic-like serine/threonine-protein kinase
MTVQTCPSDDDLQALLAEDLTPARQTEIEAHLAACPDCQQSLEQLATGGGQWCNELRDIQATQPPSESAYWPALKAKTPRPEKGSTGASLPYLSPPDKPGYIGRIEHFDVVEVIGHGGMGVVVKAFDTCLERYVAIKILEPQLANNEVAHARFCREARAAASINHENVVAIYQVLEQEETELPLLVMQLVSGESLQERLDRSPRMSVKEIVNLGAQIASGLAAAHERGLVHRDVKPGNILLEKDGTRVRITDFGLVRAVEDVKLTQTGFVGGTPLYMAPEQAIGEKIDYRADLFSLGAVLYSMCAGEPPFAESSPFLVLQRITQEAHRPLREVNPEIPLWLADLVDRLLQKKPEDRFQSAAEVAEIMNHHYAALITSGTVKCPKLEGPPTPRWQANLYSIGGALAIGAAIAASTIFASQSLFPGKAGSTTADKAESASSAEPLASLPGNAGPVWSLALSPAKNELALALDDGTFRIWDLSTNRVKATKPAHRAPIFSIAYDKAGDRIATASDDGFVKIWDAGTHEEIASLQQSGSARAVAFLPDGERIVAGTRTGAVEVWSIEEKKRLFGTDGHQGLVMTLAVSPDGTMIASASSDKTVRVWDATTGSETLKLEGHGGGVYSVAFSADSKQIVSGSWDKTVRVWDAGSGSLVKTLAGHKQDVWTVAWDPRGDRFASGGEDREVLVWKAGDDQPIARYRGHEGTLYTIAFSPDGERIVSAGRDGTVLVWPAPQSP